MSASHITQQTNRILDDVTAQSANKLYQHQTAEVTDGVVAQTWECFGRLRTDAGRYLASQIRQGRGVIVPKFGSFTFSAPKVNLTGVTNPKERDIGRRVPVFIISPNFFPGGNLKPGAFSVEFGHIRPYNNQGANGVMHLIKCNFTEIGYHRLIENPIGRVEGHCADRRGASHQGHAREAAPRRPSRDGASGHRRVQLLRRHRGGGVRRRAGRPHAEHDEQAPVERRPQDPGERPADHRDHGEVPARRSSLS